MGSVCCCVHVELPEESMNDSTHGDCKCPGCFFNTFFSKYAKVLTRDARINHEPANLDHNEAPNNAQPDTFMTHSITYPFDSNQIISNNQHEGFKESEPAVAEQLQQATEQQMRIREVRAEQKSEDYNPESVISPSQENLEARDSYIYGSGDDGDECPTCLEEYESENPKILTECNHHFHLGCIYEWMERSESCPICSKVMVFSERSLK